MTEQMTDTHTPEPQRASLFSKLKAYFFTGLVITAPIAITVWATIWFISIFDRWVKPFVPDVYNPDTYLPVRVPGFGLLFALFAITLIGALAANLVGRTLFGIWDNILQRTPVVRSIYKGSKQIFETLFAQKGSSFQKVCLVEWPRRDTWSIGFISRELDGGMVGLEQGRAMYAVYVSTTPNPTSGYVFFADVSEVKLLAISVEDALKLVISMGLVFPEKPLSPIVENRIAQPPQQPRRISRKTRA
jgi:uncharacterized membrane protein